MALATALTATAGFTAFGAADASASPTGPSSWPGAQSGTVYTETNQTSNDVLAYRTVQERHPGGDLPHRRRRHGQIARVPGRRHPG